MLKKKGNSDAEILEAIESELKEKDLFSDQVKELLVSLSGGGSQSSSNSTSMPELTHKSFSDLDDKKQRGLARKNILIA